MSAFRWFPSASWVDYFGPFGLEMSQEWIEDSGFVPVVYVKRNGFLYKGLQLEFDEALAEADERVNAEFPEDAFRHMSYTNKNVAVVFGARRWANFLTIYEYLEPASNKFQKEWRYVRPDPFYSEDSLGTILDNLEHDRGWTRHVFTLPFESSSVSRVFAPDPQVEQAEETLNPLGIRVEPWPALTRIFSRRLATAADH